MMRCRTLLPLMVLMVGMLSGNTAQAKKMRSVTMK